MATNNKRLIELALKGLQAEKEKIGQEIAELQKMVSGAVTAVTAAAQKALGVKPAAAAAPKRKRRAMTAAQKKAISATMKAKWAARRKAEGKA